QELKEKLYSALRSKAEINDLSEKLLTKFFEQEKELQQLRQFKEAGNSKKNLVDEPRPYSKVRLCKEAD
ncbi:16412_t:CDS:1, partial [Gigaspora margarita]